MLMDLPFPAREQLMVMDLNFGKHFGKDEKRILTVLILRFPDLDWFLFGIVITYKFRMLSFTMPVSGPVTTTSATM
jgi:hypothetical protein